ncbi:MAG: class I SAM-dependent methyltransferase [Bacteroidetes bacterium]|nr:MAG: class I SAM-dependent methyltransferase [Bacteroidota bacterium]
MPLQMNWKNFWDQQAAENDRQTQVARTGGKTPVSPGLMEEIADWITRWLELSPHEHLLDVCCGNGELSWRLAARCGEVTGADLSPAQVRKAEVHASDKLRFVEADARHLREVLSDPFDKINLYFSFQYLDRYAKGQEALHEMLALLAPGGRIFIGDVPDYERIDVFYPDVSSRFRYELMRLLGRDRMGKFWSGSEMERMAHAAGCCVKRIAQPAHFPYAHYRSDYVFWRR